MLLIILSWIYILFTCVNLGYYSDKIFQTKATNFIIIIILGLFTTTILASFWAIFGRINIEFHGALFLLNGLIFFKFQKEIKAKYTVFNEELRLLAKPLQVFLAVITVLIIAQCAAAPFVIDNESYYIQTIKWLNEYGFVKGLANLHISLGQTSGWHILQSAFSFSFLYKNFNDLSGFCLLIGNYFAVLILNQYFLNTKKIYLIVGLFPLANVLFFQLISAPSPDIPVYTFAFILFFYFIEKFESPSISNFTIITILSIFILFIKATALGLVLIPIIVLTIHFKELYQKLIPLTLIGIAVLSLFIIKNGILSGMPLFPLTYFRLAADFSLPESIAQFYFNSGKLCLFFLSSEEYNSMTYGQIALKWLFASKLSGFFNTLTVSILVVCPFFIRFFYNKKSFWLLYIVAIATVVSILLSSPVYRYFIYLTLFFGLFILTCLFNKKHFIYTIYGASILISAILVLFPFRFDSLTQNKLISNNSSFAIQNSIFPHQNSKLGNQFKVVQNGNLKYHSLIDNPFFWATGDGKIPCVNQNQIDYFKNHLLILPQMRTTDLKDGFYTKKGNR